MGAYALSFAVIAAVSRDHRRIFLLVRRVDARVTRVNLLLLGFSALLPFPTALLAGYGGSEPLAVTLYAADVAVINLLLLALFLIADFATTVLIAAASIVIAFTVSADAGLLTWLASLPAGLASRSRQRLHEPGRT